MKNTKRKTMSDGQSEKNSEISFHDLSFQTDKKDDSRNESAMTLALPLVKQIDEWWLTQKQDGPASNKYSITSTGNGNVDISG